MYIYSTIKKIKRQKTSLASSETGFTLLELMIVVAIIGIAGSLHYQIIWCGSLPLS
jgi:prepilin-type N-terminal cleavage/methylation domain-containing protein